MTFVTLVSAKSVMTVTVKADIKSGTTDAQICRSEMLFCAAFKVLILNRIKAEKHDSFVM